MIIEFLYGIGNFISVWVLGWLPHIPDEAAFAMSQPLYAIGSYMGSLRSWVNWPLVATQVGLVLGLYFTFMALKIVRALISHVPFFGGSG